VWRWRHMKPGGNVLILPNERRRGRVLVLIWFLGIDGAMEEEGETP
jgi:hypothetical protein